MQKDVGKIDVTSAKKNWCLDQNGTVWGFSQNDTIKTGYGKDCIIYD